MSKEEIIKALESLRDASKELQIFKANRNERTEMFYDGKADAYDQAITIVKRLQDE